MEQATPRPLYHFTPPAGWMNDPNGLVYFEGEYHLFYQHVPPGAEGLHWGHAVSEDLLHWTHLPPALMPDALGDIWSGSAIVDHNDTSGFFDGQAGLVAVFTHHLPDDQRQSLAYSRDRGRTWTKYAGNPVLTADFPDFRDPKVFWHAASGQWAMAVTCGDRIQFYASPDLKQWTFASQFGDAYHTPGTAWECPDLFPLTVEGENRVQWVLNVSEVGPANFSGGFGPCTMQYFVGDFDGAVFQLAHPPGQARQTTWGADDYAAVTWSDLPSTPERRVWIGWMNHWGYAHRVPTQPWKGQLTLPRVLALRVGEEGTRLVQAPVPELRHLRSPGQVWTDQRLGPEQTLAVEAPGAACEIIAEFELGDAAEVGVAVRCSGPERTLAGYSVSGARLFIDRTHSGPSDFSAHFPARHEAPLAISGSRVRLHVFVDTSSIEVFGNDGDVYLADLIFPGPDSQGLVAYALGGRATLRTLTVHPLVI